MDQSMFKGIKVIAKFYMSRAPNGEVSCISRTLGKFSIIDNTFDGKVEHKEMWLCEITSEVKPGQNSGAFILKPIHKVDPDSVRKLIPGFYSPEEIADGLLMLTPKTHASDYWVLSKKTRKIYSSKYYAIIVPLAID